MYLRGDNSHWTNVFECFVESIARQRLAASEGDEFKGPKGTQKCPERAKIAAEEPGNIYGREDGENEKGELEESDEAGVDKGM
jgi:hypothetical protein